MAIYLDGWQWHADRISDDLALRQSLEIGEYKHHPPRFVTHPVKRIQHEVSMTPLVVVKDLLR